MEDQFDADAAYDALLEGGDAQPLVNNDDHAADADELAQEAEVEQEESTAQVPAEENQPDIWANATPEQQEVFRQMQEDNQRLSHSESSQRGRVSALQRKLDEARKQTQQADDEEGADLNQLIADAQQAVTDAEGMKEDYPDLAPNMLRMAKANLAALKATASQQQAFGEIEQSREAHYFAEQESLVSQRHPDAVTVSTSAEFQNWLSTQPQHVQQCAASDAADDVVWLLDTFKAYSGANSQQQQIRLQQREQRKAASVTPAGRSRAKAPNLPTDPDALYDTLLERK